MKKIEDELKDLKAREAKLKAKIDALSARQKEQARKDDTRLKVLIGAAVLADAKANPQTGLFLKAILRRAVTAPRDKEFLQDKGWMNGGPESPKQPSGEGSTAP